MVDERGEGESAERGFDSFLIYLGYLNSLERVQQYWRASDLVD